MDPAKNALLYLIGRGYQPPQAAALVGNMMQESSLNPSALNQKEGAFGLMQWRLDRRKALEDFARGQGKDPSDFTTQLDFIGHEMAGPESGSASGFLMAGDLPSANAALKKYIRYGDQSLDKRLANSQGLLNIAPTDAPYTVSPHQSPISGPAQFPMMADATSQTQENDPMALFNSFGTLTPDAQTMQQLQPPIFPSFVRKKVAVNIPRARRA